MPEWQIVDILHERVWSGVFALATTEVPSVHSFLLVQLRQSSPCSILDIYAHLLYWGGVNFLRWEIYLSICRSSKKKPCKMLWNGRASWISIITNRCLLPRLNAGSCVGFWSSRIPYYDEKSAQSFSTANWSLGIVYNIIVHRILSPVVRDLNWSRRSLQY